MSMHFLQTTDWSMFENCLPKASAHIARENIAWDALKPSPHLAVVIQNLLLSTFCSGRAICSERRFSNMLYC